MKLGSDRTALQAAERAAEVRSDYSSLLMRNTFPDMFADGGYPAWGSLSDGAREMARRDALLQVFVYLYFRQSRDPALRTELFLLSREIGAPYISLLAKLMERSAAEIVPDPKAQRAFGFDCDDPVNALGLFAWEEGTSASLLLDAYRREEIRRLDEKAWRMKNGAFDERAVQSDDSWRRRNEELLGCAEEKAALSKEAMAIRERRPTTEDDHGRR